MFLSTGLASEEPPVSVAAQMLLRVLALTRTFPIPPPVLKTQGFMPAAHHEPDAHLKVSVPHSLEHTHAAEEPICKRKSIDMCILAPEECTNNVRRNAVDQNDQDQHFLKRVADAPLTIHGQSPRY